METTATSPENESQAVRPSTGSGRTARRRADESRPFLQHLEDLRRRLLRSLLWVALGAAIAFHFAPRIMAGLLEPVGRVVFLSPAEPFIFQMKVVLLGGILLSSPLLAWEAWGFLSPAFFLWERSALFVLVPLTTGLFLSGALFGWKVLLPVSLSFFLSFSSEGLTPMITLGHYIGFAAWMILGSGIVFLTPLAVLALAWARALRPKTLLRQWRIAVVAILVFCAVITPTPDVVTQLLLAVPMGALYLLSIGLAFLFREWYVSR